MGKKEANTDLWVYNLLKEAKISENFTAQGSDIQEIIKIKEISEFY
jgi:restriction enzyme bgcI subunit alpha